MTMSRRGRAGSSDGICIIGSTSSPSATPSGKSSISTINKQFKPVGTRLQIRCPATPPRPSTNAAYNEKRQSGENLAALPNYHGSRFRSDLRTAAPGDGYLLKFNPVPGVDLLRRAGYDGCCRSFLYVQNDQFADDLPESRAALLRLVGRDDAPAGTLTRRSWCLDGECSAAVFAALET